MKKLRIVFIVFTVFLNFQVEAQYFAEHEFSISAGIFQLRSDYGVRNDSETNFGNQGTSISVSYYYNPAYLRRKSYFFEHFKYRFNLMFSSVDLQHFGPFVSDPRLEAMTGSYTNFSINNGLEYYPFKGNPKKGNANNSFFNKFSPYAGLGIGLNFINTTAQSSLNGGLSDINNVFPTFISDNPEQGIITGSDTVFNLNLRVGLRVILNLKNQILIESGWMIFNSDLVDGLNPVGPQNQNSDWAWGINLGYSYSLF